MRRFLGLQVLRRFAYQVWRCVHVIGVRLGVVARLAICHTLSYSQFVTLLGGIARLAMMHLQSPQFRKIWHDPIQGC